VIYPDDNIELNTLEEIEEKKGKLGTSEVDDKLMRSVLSNDRKKIDDGKLISEAINYNVGSFTPDMMFKNLVDNFKLSSKLYGERLIRQVTGYDADYVERNRKIPEFKDELKKNISSRIKQLKKEKLIDKEGIITKKGLELSSVIMYLEEIENLKSHGFLGEKVNKKNFTYGERDDIKKYKKGTRYKDIDVRASIKLAIKRNHDTIYFEDLKAVDRKAKGNIEIVYAIDASASMKGKKIEMAKKAGIALAFKAIEEKNKVGLIIFGDDVKEEVSPTNDFGYLLQKINAVKATNQTNISKTINKAYELFNKNDTTKHLIIITDAMPTEGEDPNKETLDSCSNASAANITISIIGISLNKAGKKLAGEMTEIGNGRLHIAEDINNLDILVLRDYFEEV